ncbi:MAG: peptide ABC transporter substrate-binding protein [Erysipelotrichaceae bacterium]|nr:peptide ABC transporter substrate-binding protein [Erysipelotrichaceae bacterium]
MNVLKKVFSAVLCGAMALTLASCGSGDTTESDTSSVVLMSENDLLTLDSSQATDGTALQVIQAFTDGLYGYASYGTVTQDLAEDVTISEDGLTYTITLREAYWSNGTQVTANDFVYAWKRLITEGSEYAYLLGSTGFKLKNADAIMDDGEDADILGIIAQDDTTLVLELESQCSYIEALLAFPTFFPLNQEFVESCGDQYGTTVDNLIGCGAFTLTTYEVGNKVVLTKNADYYDADEVTIDEVTINLAQDQSAAALQFDSGELDYCIISSALVDSYSEKEEYSTINNGFLWYIYLNFENEYLANENIRKGLSAAIDREDLCYNILNDGSSPATGFVPAELCTNSDGTDFAEACGDLLAEYEINYNLEKAQEYIDAGLAELGVDEINISMLYGTDEGVNDVATYLEQAFNALEGVNFTLSATQKEARIESLKVQDFEMALSRWGPDYADSSTYLDLLGSDQMDNYNYGQYSNEDYDELIYAARTESDTETREQLLMDANALATEECAVISIFCQGQAVLTSSRMTGLLHNACGTPYIYKYIQVTE